MTMADYINVVEEFESFLEDTLEISDIESFRTDYPKAYSALQLAFQNEQEAARAADHKPAVPAASVSNKVVTPF